MICDVFIEISKDSNIKYEYDKDLGAIRLDRVLKSSMVYPENYGYIPNTLSGDGDPLDILLVCDYPIYPGTVVNVKVVGVLLTTDEKGEDEKLIAVPSKPVDPSFDDINTLEDLGTLMKKRIFHFFEHYKDIDENKWVEIKGFKNAEEAYKVYSSSYKKYIKNP